MSEVILSVKDLKVNYGGIEAVKGISFDVKEGSILTLIGANGAGKSTTLKAIIGLEKPSSGSISFKGENITGMDTSAIVSKGITLVPEGRRVFPNLTVLENIKIGAYLRKDDLDDDIEWVYSLFPRLKEREWQLAGTLSGGEQQMLAIGRALMGSPRMLLLDEPSLGLAPLLIRDIFETLKEIRREGTTILIVEQNALATLKIADYAYVLELGKISMHGPADELMHDARLMEAYLGG